ncbi:hypothetical protein BpHYR1_054139 [Brachionus plicatilis]|uniref:Uncharacterized protein n=1 Tax=Brachionus plicatilis TaxID=10195 RepID=A0A3M7S8R3_BRAPC|nr:hypothetical protein BpHYR1_054139 [Brachionus plicatilis]
MKKSFEIKKIKPNVCLIFFPYIATFSLVKCLLISVRGPNQKTTKLHEMNHSPFLNKNINLLSCCNESIRSSLCLNSALKYSVELAPSLVFPPVRGSGSPFR